MTRTTTNLILLGLVTAAVFAPLVAAQAQDQTSTGAWHGQDSEYGSVRAPYSVTINGVRADALAHVVLRKNYDDKGAAFTMFSFTTQNSPQLDATFDHITRADNGQEIPCYNPTTKESGPVSKVHVLDNGNIECFVDSSNMPPVGVEIDMSGSVGAKKAGQFQVGMSIIAFDYKWNKMQMSNGLDAELYGYSMVNVNKPTAQESTGIAGVGNKVPGVGLVGSLAAIAVVAVGITLARRRS